MRNTQAEDDIESGTRGGVSNGVEGDNQERVYIVSSLTSKLTYISRITSLQSASKVHCHIAYGQLAVNLPAGHLESAIPVLIDILRDIPHVQFEPSLNWTGIPPANTEF